MMLAGCAAQQKKTIAPVVTEKDVVSVAAVDISATGQAVSSVASDVAVVSATTLRVEEALFCEGVKDRIPQGAAENFDASVKKVFFFNRVTGSNQPTSITHVWYWNERKMAEVPLDVRSSNWRTWSSKRIDPSWKGSWAVKVLDANGEILTAKNFEVR